MSPVEGENDGVRQLADVDEAGVVATVMPLGSGSVKLIPVTLEELELVNAIDKVDVPPLVIATLENDLVIEIGETMVA